MTGPRPVPAPAWGSLTSPDAARRARVLLVPLGSVEQHGPHLPLDTDTRIAVAVAERVAARAAGSTGGRRPTDASAEVLVAPAVAYGASGEHEGFAGTLSIGQQALELVVVELVRSAGPEVAATILVNGHGGNVEAVRRAVALLHAEGRSVALWSPSRRGADAHAGRVETSVLLALSPELVRTDRAEPGNTEPLDALLPRLRAGGLAAVTANGVLGDPAGASGAEGEALLDAMVDDLEHLVVSVATGGRLREHA
jgi:creatinine amidohydrolase